MIDWPHRPPWEEMLEKMILSQYLDHSLKEKWKKKKRGGEEKTRFCDAEVLICLEKGP